jgi:hypothetical protein
VKNKILPALLHDDFSLYLPNGTMSKIKRRRQFEHSKGRGFQDCQGDHGFVKEIYILEKLDILTNGAAEKQLVKSSGATQDQPPQTDWTP